ncbi:MAG: dUTP diphosphatase [Bdellovibrionota bacterium]
MPAVLKYFVNDEAKSAGIGLRVPRELDAGFDLPALRQTTILPGAFALIETGVHLAIPEGWVGIIRDRSSVALRGGITSAGVIDASYRGEVKVAFRNLGAEPIVFQPGDRIAQCVVLPHLTGSHSVAVESLDALGDTERGQGGFGSTGK